MNYRIIIIIMMNNAGAGFKPAPNRNEQKN